MFEIRRYHTADQPLWDDYVSRARNATFLFYRAYMDYHADRFLDHSLMVYRSCFIKVKGSMHCFPRTG